MAKVNLPDELGDVSGAKWGGGLLGASIFAPRGVVAPSPGHPLPPAVPGRQPIADGTRHRLFVPVYAAIFARIQGDDVERVLMERAPHNGVHGSVGSV